MTTIDVIPRLQKLRAGSMAGFPQDTIDAAISAIRELVSERDRLRAALLPFAALLQPHNDKGGSDTPIFAINNAPILLGDLRVAAREASSDNSGGKRD
jgi:hypothetical protein